MQGAQKKTSDEEIGNPKYKGHKKRPLIKKEATLKHKGLKRKSSNEKSGNPKTQGAQKEDLR
jgi:hypothetical protein